MVAGIMKTPAQCTHQPPCWGAYVTVDDIDATTSKIEGLGGKIIVPPTDIPNIGRFSVFTDPQGAVLSAITYFPQQQ
jgi:predicted enzyme related to lactoylglutathione lyase